MSTTPDDEAAEAGSGPIGPPVRRGPGAMGSAGMPTAKPAALVGSTQRLLGRLRPERAAGATVVALAVVSVVLTVLGPKLLGTATDIVFDGIRSPDAGIDFGSLNRTLLIVCGLYLGASALAYLQSYLLAGVVQRTMRRLRSDVEDKIHRVPLRYLDRKSRGDLLSRVTNDIDNIAQSLQQTLSQLLTAVLTLFGVLVMMLLISPTLALVAIVTVPLALLTTKAISSRSKPRFVEQWSSTGALNAQVEEAFTGHTLVQVFGRRSDTEATFDETNQDLYQSSFRAQFISGAIQPMMMLLSNANLVAIAVIGGLRVASGAVSLGDIQAFIQYSRQFSQPLTQVASMMNVLQSGLASAERVFELLDAPEQAPDGPDADAVPGPTTGRVSFGHVRFAYIESEPLITDLSFTAEPGQSVAIVGPTGSGKTTLVNLLMRFYEIDGGRITVDGVDITEMSRDRLRAATGMVLQDTWLFEGTIRENIAYGNPAASEAEVRRAAEATYVDRFVRSLPDGYDTIVDADGGNLSAGERQLLTIARAFLSDPTILILDEATSSVDTRTEVLVQQAMAALRSDRTSFVIAHRLSTIRDADVILVLEAGDIVEQGSHTELLAAGGAYAALYRSQFAGALHNGA